MSARFKHPLLNTLRWVMWIVIGSAMVLLAITIVIGLAMSTSGVFTTQRGDWVTQVHLARNTSISVNVPGALRLATSGPGLQLLQLLDGRSLRTRFGTLQLARDGDTLVARCAPCVLRHPALHHEPLLLNTAELRLRKHDDVKLDGSLRTGDVTLQFNASLQRDHALVQWSLPATQIAALVQALAAAVPEAQRASIEGRIAAHGSLRLPAGRGSGGLTLVDLRVDGLNTETLWTEALQFNCSSAQGGTRRVTTGLGQKNWATLEAMQRVLVPAVLAAEDQRFYAHAGFDADELSQVLAAFDTAPSAKNSLRGASTITQQLARTLFTGHERTAVRKLRELLYAVEMERTLGKDRILELYLNTVDWGPGLCGARDAAREYFGVRPSQLTPMQAAWMASILKAPHAAYANPFAQRQPYALRAERVIEQMRNAPRRERQRWMEKGLEFRGD